MATDTTCPLCGSPATRWSPPTGDRSGYSCPTDKVFEISGTEETAVRNNPDAATAHRERIARERSRGFKIPGVGVPSR
jgi:hypothetical protein